MSHELGTFEYLGVEWPTICYAEGGQVPWHGLGQVIASDVPASDWLKWSGLDYDVETRPNCRADGSAIDSSYHIARIDTGAIMGPFVAGQYQPFQNREALELAVEICETHGFRLDTAGVLFGGAKAWVQVQSDLDAELPGGDRLANSIVVAPAHDGRTATRLIATNVRVVCNNTMSAAIARASDADTASFHHRVPFDADAIVQAVGQNAESFAEFAKIAHDMAGRILSDAERLAFFQAVIGGKEKIDDSGRVTRSVGVRRAMAFASGRDFVADGKTAPDVVRVVDEAIERARRGSASDAEIVADDIVSNDSAINPGYAMESANGTLWGAFNTVSWLADQKPAKSRGLDHAIASSLLADGQGARLKASAMREARELLAA
jgi:phage/plasmid-like protein (TIGR03299 family)